MSIQLTPDQEVRLVTIAMLENRTADEVAQEAVALFLAKHAAEEREISEAEQEADRDGWLTQDEVFRNLRTRLSKAA